MIRFFMACLLLAGTAVSAHAQAFGVHMGDPVSRYGGTPTGIANQYKITVPQPHGEFKSYFVTATPQTGICAVSGGGRMHENDKSGFAVRSSFKSLHGALSARYGKSKDFDFLHAGALWKEPHEFSWSLYKEERTLSSFWDDKQRSQNLGEIETIGLWAEAVSSTGTYLILRYEFRNLAKCRAIMEGKDNSGL
jgi:hypothetical protein